MHAEALYTFRERMKDAFQFLNEMSDEEIEYFLGFCENRRADAGETLWSEGDGDSYAVFIMS
ncbi:MAG: hypothetical protein AB1499_09845, partial [Nitrospirota bacterium]